MTWPTQIRTWLRGVFQRNRVENDMESELRFHLDAYADDLVRQGIPRDEALRRARLEFGPLESKKEECRASLGLRLWDETQADIRYAFRSLRKSPAFTIVAILTLALGIGANTAIFTLIDAILFRLVPVHNAQELYQLRIHRPGSDSVQDAFTNPLWESLRTRQDVFSEMASWGNVSFDLSSGGAIRPADGIWVSGNFFSTLGVRPAIGRLIGPHDDRRGCPAIAVVSYGFWQDHYAGSPSVVGSSILLNAQSFEIVGVSQRGFDGLDIGMKFDVAAPNCATVLMDGKRSRLDQRSWWWLTVIGRANPGVSRQQVAARLRAVSPQVFAAAVPLGWDKQGQDSFLHRWCDVIPVGAGISWSLRQNFEQPLWVMMGVAGVVLLIACANIAALLLARAARQRREIAVRLALGASRLRLVRGLFMHAAILSCLGAVAGVILSRWGTSFLLHCISRHDQPLFLNLSPDWRVIAFTSAAALITAALFGIIPGLRSTRVRVTESMNSAGKLNTDRDTPLRKAIVAAQIALSLALLITAGLFLRSFAKLMAIDPGFDKHSVLLVTANLKNAPIKPENQEAVLQTIQDRLARLPGVTSVARSEIVPLSNRMWDQPVQTDLPASTTANDSDALMNAVTPGYFATMRISLLAGRDFSQADTGASPEVAIVNQSLVRKLFPAVNPIGHILRVKQSAGNFGPPIQIVGVASDSKYTSLRDEIAPTVFFPTLQVPKEPAYAFCLRTAIMPSSMITAVEKAVAGVNGGIPLEFNTLEQELDDVTVQERVLALLSTFFGGVAVLLAEIGLYGTVSYRVAMRRPEFGIRLALGARVGTITRMVLREVLMIVLPGLAAGVAISFAAATAVQKLLFGLAPRDAATFLGAAAILAAVVLLAAYAPARRAARTDPMAALRYE